MCLTDTNFFCHLILLSDENHLFLDKILELYSFLFYYIFTKKAIVSFQFHKARDIFMILIKKNDCPCLNIKKAVTKLQLLFYSCMV